MGLTVPVRPLPAFRQTDVQRAAFNEERSLERSSTLAGLQLWPNLKDCIARPRQQQTRPDFAYVTLGAREMQIAPGLHGDCVRQAIDRLPAE
jgi:hypothetical protein